MERRLEVGRHFMFEPPEDGGGQVPGDSPGIRVDVRYETDIDVVAVAGEIDIATAPHLEDVLSTLSAADVVIDLTGVEFMDSTGLQCLVNARVRSDPEPRIRLLVQRPGPVLRLLELAGLAEWFMVDEVATSE
jgi:anti-sigma B factor antagonist